MAYVIPTPPDIRAAYPEFTAVSDGVIQGALDETALAVDQSWPVSAYNLAYKLHTAHLLVSGGQGSSAQAIAVSGSPAGLKMRKSGDTVEEFFQSQGQGSGAGINVDAWFMSTGYGQRFMILRRRFFGGPRVLAVAVPAPAGPYFYPFD